MKRLQKEILILVLIFLFLALFMHFTAWIDHPIEHIKRLSSSALGFWHPFVITFLVYVLLSTIKGIGFLIKRVKV